MGKQKNGKKGRPESLVLGELFRYGKSKNEEEKELSKLKQEGVLYLDDIRIGESGFSYNITNEDRSRRKNWTQVPERMRPFNTKTKRSWLSQNPIILANPKPQDYPHGLEHLDKVYQMRRAGWLERKISDQEWLQLRRAESRIKREEIRERTYMHKRVKETINKPIITREPRLDLAHCHSISKDENEDNFNEK